MAGNNKDKGDDGDIMDARLRRLMKNALEDKELRLSALRLLFWAIVNLPPNGESKTLSINAITRSFATHRPLILQDIRDLGKLGYIAVGERRVGKVIYTTAALLLPEG
jgi:hypothetical protein